MRNGYVPGSTTDAIAVGPTCARPRATKGLHIWRPRSLVSPGRDLSSTLLAVLYVALGVHPQLRLPVGFLLCNLFVMSFLGGPPPFALDNMLGAAFIGIVMSTAMYGVTCLQVYLYYTQHCSRDSLFLKLYVVVVMILETFHVALVSTAFYWYTVTNFGDFEVLTHNTWSLQIEVVVGEIVTALVQCFFAYRIYNLGAKRIYTPIAICTLAVVQLGMSRHLHNGILRDLSNAMFPVMGIVYVAKMFPLNLFSTARSALPFSASSLTADLLNNLIITVYMVYFLRKGQPKVMELYTRNRNLNLMIAYVLNSGFLATVFTLVNLVTNLAVPASMVYALFYFVTIRLYSCMMMSTSVALPADHLLRC
ncbi:hypothetical protein B0H21DRAFT_758473 [Amylocystis lapponica]|nr:hypothetical protein B0H21DRAFT_758473 [Amylocystis lapponica]